jgi:hypothetical protein
MPLKAILAGMPVAQTDRPISESRGGRGHTVPCRPSVWLAVFARRSPLYGPVIVM